MEEKEIGLIGLGVMGASLCLNLASKGYEILAYNRDQEKARKFMDSRAVGLPIAQASTLQELIKGVKRPRKILLMCLQAPRWIWSCRNCSPSWNLEIF